MSELGIYEGCYVELRNGEVVGPVEQDVPYFRKIWKLKDTRRWWNADGTSHFTAADTSFDIIRVIDPADMVSVPLSDQPEAPKGVVATIPPHVTRAAMDAGIKAEPAYEQFVNAVLEAGFRAQYGIEFVPVVEQAAPAVTDEMLESVASVFGNKGFYEWGGEAQSKIRGAVECVLSFCGSTAVPQNESENRIQDSEKAKGGLSDPTSPPLDGVTIVFTGNTNMPRDTHKGIAESLGARVAGSVHKHTTLVVYGPGAGSKLDKANELCLPRMSEEAWLWLAARFGYGKATRVSPYGKITSPRVEIEPKLARLPDPTPVEFTPPTIPSVETIDEAIRVAVREWRETNPDMGMVPPIAMIAKKVHAVIVDVSPATVSFDTTRGEQVIAHLVRKGLTKKSTNT